MKKSTLTLFFLLLMIGLKAQTLELRRHDDFGILMNSAKNLYVPSNTYANLYLNSPDAAEMVIYNSGELMHRNNLYIGFLPAPWDQSKELSFNDSIINLLCLSLYNVGRNQTKANEYGTKTKVEVSKPIDYPLSAIPNTKSYVLSKVELKNEGVVGKEGWEITGEDQVIIGYSADRIFVAIVDFGRSKAVVYIPEPEKEGKKKIKEKLNNILNGSSSSEPDAKTKSKDVYNQLSTIQINESPLEKANDPKENGFYFTLDPAYPVQTTEYGNYGGQAYYRNGRVFKGNNGFFGSSYDGVNKLESFESVKEVLVKIDSSSSLESAICKQIGIENLYFFNSAKTVNSKIKQEIFGLVMIKVSAGVYYQIALENDSERNNALWGGYGVKYKKLVNVFVKNRKDMPSRADAELKAKDFVEKYYAYLKKNAETISEEYNQDRKKYNGRAIIYSVGAGSYIFSYDKTKFNLQTISEISALGKESVNIRFYIKDGKQPAWDEKDFIVTTIINGKSIDINQREESIIGKFVTRAPGSHFFECAFFVYTSEETKDFFWKHDRAAGEYGSSAYMRMLHEIFNKHGIKEGFSGNLTLQLKNKKGEIISEGTVKITVPKGSFTGETPFCYLPDWSIHIPEEEQKVAQMFTGKSDVKKVVRVIMNSGNWSDDKRGFTYGRYKDARVIYEDKSGTFYCKAIQLYQSYQAGAYSPNYKLNREYTLDRPINCNCDIAK